MDPLVALILLIALAFGTIAYVLYREVRSLRRELADSQLRWCDDPMGFKLMCIERRLRNINRKE